MHYKYSYLDRLETDRDGTNVNKPTKDVLVTYTKVYALIEKYLIRRLKAIALRQFKAVATIRPFISLDINDFLQATWEVYISTIEDDKGLRNIVVETLYK